MDKYIFIDTDNLFGRIKVIVNAVQWTGINSHPHDKKRSRIVSRYLKRSDISKELCPECKKPFSEHGKMKITKSEDLSNKHRTKVCPGDWIINYEKDYWACPKYLFYKIYKKV